MIKYARVCISNSINCFRAAEIKRGSACAYLVDGIIISWYNNDQIIGAISDMARLYYASCTHFR